MKIISPLDPSQIRKSKEAREEERRQIKVSLKAQLVDRGDIAHIHRLLNAIKPIKYASVSYALNPKHGLWSPRVVEFAERYVATKQSLQSSQAQS